MDLPSSTFNDLDTLPAFSDEGFRARYLRYEADAVGALRQLYGDCGNFPDIVATIMTITGNAHEQRPAALKQLDLSRSQEPDWFRKSDRIGYTGYVDRFAGTLAGIGERIAYLKELGVTYLHLLPVLQPRAGRNDGGYAIADYYRINPEYGTMADLRALAAELRRNDISLCMDFVCNHTSDDHAWAKSVLKGEPQFRDYYFLFEDRRQPDAYEKTLEEIFAGTAPGNFTPIESLDAWVWTTFYPYQWDLNYANPAVFAHMLKALLFLANQGVEVFRLDSAPFLWKRLGTNCQNQPETHLIIRALRALVNMAAPAVLLKAEAVVPSDQLVRYLGRGANVGKECHLAYNTTLMTQLWSALASGTITRLVKVLKALPPIPARASWLTYVRCHDDIVWSVLNNEQAGYSHEDWLRHARYLSAFYGGQVSGSFAAGELFQTRKDHQVHGTSGSMASLCGLEKALAAQDQSLIDLAIARILMMYSVVFAYGGIALINMGDEVGLLNDRDYQTREGFDGDGRWLHRAFMDEKLLQARHDKESVAGRIFAGMTQLAAMRARCLPRHVSQAELIDTGSGAVLGLHHTSSESEMIALANFSDHPAHIALGGFGKVWFSCADGKAHTMTDLTLPPYGYLWLTPKA